MSRSLSSSTPAASRAYGAYAAFAAVLLLALLPLWIGGFTLRFAAEILLIGVAVMSLNVLIGVGGLVSLGHAALFGAAAYVAAVAAAVFGSDVTVMLGLGVLTGAGLGAVMALISLRTAGLFFLVLTLLMGQMVWELVFRWRSLTGGADGLRGFPPLSGFGVSLGSADVLYALALAIALVGWWVLRSFRRAPIGLALQGMRDQPLRMRAMGYRLGVLRVAAFATTGAMAGLAGALYPFVNQYVGPNVVHWSMSATLVIMGVLGGIGTLVGGFVGAAVYLVAQTQLSSFTDRWQLAIGLLFVATVIFVPHGLWSAAVQRVRGARARADVRTAAPPASISASSAVPANWTSAAQKREQPPRPGEASKGGEAQMGGAVRQGSAAQTGGAAPSGVVQSADGADVILRVADVSHAFGGVPVLSGVDFTLMAGETLGLIGPNGAGKTTLFNIISGFITPDAGQLRFGGHDLARQSPEARSRLGLVRTFQKSLVFPTLSVRGNVALAVRATQATGYAWRAAEGALAAADRAADHLLADSPFSGREDTLVADLSYGEKRILDVLIALAQAPQLLLLDEPTAGLAEAEARDLLALVRHRHARTAVILVSHDVDVVFRACDRIAVLDLGHLIAVDTPDRIRADARVLTAYLGVAPQVMAEVAS